MQRTFEAYRDAMSDFWPDWWLSWPLSRRVVLGDVLVHDGDAVRSAGTLAERGVAFATRTQPTEDHFVYDSAGSAKVNLKAAGATDAAFSSLAQAEAGIRVEFGRDAGVLAVFNGLTQSGVADTRRLASDLAALIWQGRWDPALLAVTELVHVGAGTVLSAAGSGAEAELRLSAGLGAGPVQLADLATGAALSKRNRLGLEWVGRELTPFYRVVRIRRSWLGKVSAEYDLAQPGRGAAPTPVPPLLLAEAQEDPATVLETVAVAEQPAPSDTGAGSDTGPGSQEGCGDHGHGS
ncbi:hypothetical protein ABT112_19810 [Streptomyces sp. NPDC002055]|uniref:hypothetical protein n=1 Tax=Streptomyces sp. NPDC002055 TaxID=3154534 RepID=UPI003324C7D1